MSFRRQKALPETARPPKSEAKSNEKTTEKGQQLGVQGGVLEGENDGWCGFGRILLVLQSKRYVGCFPCLMTVESG